MWLTLSCVFTLFLLGENCGIQGDGDMEIINKSYEFLFL